MSEKIDSTQNIYKQKLERFFTDKAITFNGINPWDIRVHNTKLYERIATEGSLGFGEAYMDGWWDCERLEKPCSINSWHISPIGRAGLDHLRLSLTIMILATTYTGRCWANTWPTAAAIGNMPRRSIKPKNSNLT